ncbi:expressed unknown protein [Ectocarpus siliculosus]|uniref:Uncharacterized protein n=1 Tax=Ectocarpus siliculosus TaxID=2880 RepID=D7FH35_ECTSI|nr:expressed unknown protein [Ectocarpus siliculosus]|eukprot:CBJ34119.1 expressed unknown protein [Ectocarpus siliculosus]
MLGLRARQPPRLTRRTCAAKSGKTSFYTARADKRERHAGSSFCLGGDGHERARYRHVLKGSRAIQARHFPGRRARPCRA